MNSAPRVIGSKVAAVVKSFNISKMVSVSAPPHVLSNSHTLSYSLTKLARTHIPLS